MNCFIQCCCPLPTPPPETELTGLPVMLNDQYTTLEELHAIEDVLQDELNQQTQCFWKRGDPTDIRDLQHDAQKIQQLIEHFEKPNYHL